MKNLTALEIYQLTRKAGFDSVSAVTATAIALAESGGNPTVIGDINIPSYGSSSVGLFQINYVPTQRKVPWRDPVKNLDPYTNAKNAFIISNGGQNFNPWITYKNGAYLQFMPHVTAASGVVEPKLLAVKALPEAAIRPLSLDLPESNQVLFRGKALSSSLFKQITNMTIDSSTTQITELTIEMEDPDFKILKSGLYELDTPVTYKDMKLMVSVIETGAGGGRGGVTIKCRPKVVRDLKLLRGPKLLNGSATMAGTASDYVKSECKLVGAGTFIEKSTPYQYTMAREQPKPGAYYQASDYPSAWTTLQTMAEYSKYIMFEYEGIIYFAQPTTVVAANPMVEVIWGDKDKKQAMSFPKFRRSVDTENVILGVTKPYIEVSIDLPLSRVNELKLGHGLVIRNYPYFAGTYMITGISYPLLGGGVVTVTATTAVNPFPQQADESSNGILDALLNGVSSVTLPGGSKMGNIDRSRG